VAKGVIHRFEAVQIHKQYSEPGCRETGSVNCFCKGFFKVHTVGKLSQAIVVGVIPDFCE